jgi:hypothetical protein
MIIQMVRFTELRILCLICGVLATWLLSGCNLPSNQAITPTLDVTQAYQTVQARLTQAIAQTPKITPTNPPNSTSTPTSAPTQPTAALQTPTTAATNPGTDLCDQALPGNPIDVTIPDDTEMLPGEEFTKIWRLQNAGTCTWTSDYSLVWFSGDQFGAPDNVRLDGSVAPGANVDLSVDMTAPDTPGSYISYWKLRNASGVLFGIGPSGGAAFWVKINVVAQATSTVTPTLETTATATITPTPGVQVAGSASLQLGDGYDLDTNQVNSGDVDLIYQAADQNHDLAPQGNTRFALYGATQPSLSDCQGLNLGSAPVAIDTLVGYHFCYQTNSGLPGRMLITALDGDTGQADVDIYTWLIP